MQNHKFKIGQSVSFSSGPFGRGGKNEAGEPPAEFAAKPQPVVIEAMARNDGESQRRRRQTDEPGQPQPDVQDWADARANMAIDRNHENLLQGVPWL